MYFESNKNELVKTLNLHLNELLQAKNSNKAHVIKNSLINTNYAYHIFLGKKTNPSRDKIIAIGLAMDLNFEEIQYLLRYAGSGALYPRNSRDTVIISAVEQNFSVSESNLFFEKMNEIILS